MKKLFTNSTGSLTMIVCLLIVVHIPAYFLFPFGAIGQFMQGFMILLLAITLLKGSVTGLFWSLPYLFILGGTLFYSQMPAARLPMNSIAIPLPYFLVYGFTLILLIVLSGYAHDRITGASQVIDEQKEKIRQFIAVDTETGFDNRERMQLEVTGEMKRIERYGGAFVMLYLQIEHFHEFRKLYGEKEKVHLLSSLAYKLEEMMRATDRKFRYDTDSLAVLLTNTTDESLEIVIEKMRKRLKVHQLLNGNYIDLSFHIGYLLHDTNSGQLPYDELLEKVESGMITHAI